MSRPLIYSPDEVATSPAVAAVISALPHVPRKAMKELCPEAADTPDALDLLDKLIVHSPRNRLTAAQACTHVFFFHKTNPGNDCLWLVCLRVSRY
jgi:serine/threonine protein kinase